MVIPNRAKIDLEAIKTTTRAMIGNHCRLVGNIRARSISVGNHLTLFGSIRTTGNISTGAGCTIHGNLASKEKVKIGRNCKVLGKVTADSILVHETSRVDGDLIAANGVTIERDDLDGLDDTGKKLFYGFILLENR
jgi:predicted acyltransferase (DUF342 family)